MRARGRKWEITWNIVIMVTATLVQSQTSSRHRPYVLAVPCREWHPDNLILAHATTNKVRYE